MREVNWRKTKYGVVKAFPVTTGNARDRCFARCDWELTGGMNDVTNLTSQSFSKLRKQSLVAFDVVRFIFHLRRIPNTLRRNLLEPAHWAALHDFRILLIGHNFSNSLNS